MLALRTMTPADLPSGLKLKTQAGWNQLEADWRRALDLAPAGCFLAEWQGIPVGTTTCCLFGPKVAWIAMVLVEASMRGRGIGKTLMQHALDWLDRQGVASAWLDATALGKPLYEKLGFVQVGTFLRYAGSPVAPARSAAPLPTDEADREVKSAQADMLPEVLDLDRAVYGYDRANLLRWLHAAQPAATRVCLRSGRLAGFLMSRPGANATHLGPCVAEPDAGTALVADALARHAGRPVFVDVPESHGAVRSLLQKAGLEVQRPLVRMVRGPATAVDLERVWAGSGPEKG